MVTAIVLIKARRESIADAARRLMEIRGVKEVYSVAGGWDLVAIARVKKNERLADLVTGELGKVDGILRTQTLIAFSQYSDYDLERLFEVSW